MLALRLPRPSDSDLVLEWRNSPDVARFMYRDDPIPATEHANWFPSTLFDGPNTCYRVAEWNGRPSGWISLSRIDRRNRSCEWGGYLAPSAPRGTGIGRHMLAASLDLAFTGLGLHRLVVEVLDGNDRAIGLYKALGFTHEGVLRQRAWQSTGPRDVIIMSILATEWIGGDGFQ